MNRRHFVGATVASVARMDMLHAMGPRAGTPLSALTRATAWINSPPLMSDALRGTIVVAAFGTYTCINWLRTLPWIRAWAAKYREHGLVMLGVHTPEFGFEKDLDNVRREVTALRLGFPVAVDNDYAIWRAFDNNYWPALYFMDASGEVRHRHFGEGKYEEGERTIQRLLKDNGTNGISRDLVEVQGSGVEAPADWASLATPETYLGSDRAERFTTDSARLRPHEWSLAGQWNRGREAPALERPNGRIICRFRARDVNLVLGPSTRGAPVRFRVRLDGQAPGKAHGVDTDEDGVGRVTDQRLYQLIRQPRPIKDRLFDIEFLDAGAEAFAFTFG